MRLVTMAVVAVAATAAAAAGVVVLPSSSAPRSAVAPGSTPASPGASASLASPASLASSASLAVASSTVDRVGRLTDLDPEPVTVVAPLTSSTNPFDVAAVGDQVGAVVEAAKARSTSAGGGLAGSIGRALGLVFVALVSHLETTQTPFPTCDDATFLRRATFDLAGRPPTQAELDALAGDARPDRRERVVDRLLMSDDHARHWGEAVLAPRLGAPRGSNLERWCVEVVRRDVPLREALTDLTLGDYGGGDGGKAFEDVYRGPRERSDRLLESFAAKPTKCARCHDAQDYHGITDPLRDDPFWTREQNWGQYAALAEVRWEADAGGALGVVQPGFALDGVAGPNKGAADRSLPALAPSDSAPQWRKAQDFPERVVGTYPLMPYDNVRARRLAFAERLRASRAVMRGTGHWLLSEVMGPILDPNRILARTEARAVGKRVLAACGDVLAAGDTSLRRFLRALLTSRIYQATTSDGPHVARFAKHGVSPEAVFARPVVRRLRAEAMARALSTFGLPVRGATDEALVLTLFGAPLRRATVTERETKPNAAQALVLLNGPGTQLLPGSLSAEVAAGVLPLRAAVDEVARRVIGRALDPQEHARLEAIRAVDGPSAAEWLEDVASVLATSHELVLRR